MGRSAPTCYLQLLWRAWPLLAVPLFFCLLDREPLQRTRLNTTTLERDSDFRVQANASTQLVLLCVQDSIQLSIFSGDVRELTFDGAVHSRLRCLGDTARPLLSTGVLPCEDLKETWHCKEADVSREGWLCLFPYVRDMLLPLLAACRKRSADLLFLGLGGGTIQTYLAAHCPKSTMTTVEIDPSVVLFAQRFFGFAGNVVVGDAHEHIGSLLQQTSRFDAVVADICSETPIDWAQVLPLLKTGGLALQNWPERSSEKSAGSFDATAPATRLQSRLSLRTSQTSRFGSTRGAR
eukprot:TRINITY_DN49856_c0_g1_i1.p1 TRINITY_DN49856_c0_g1~~TRINITY_DN49856_c0_g1_i1.p1  ORF type:complete len:293 (-),score=45.69 TRINITY_DN49856_c0_g1_i1:127-1005(-)